MDIDLEELAALVELLKAAEFSEFRYDKGDLHIAIRRGGATADEDPAPAPMLVRKSAAVPAASPVQRVAAPRSAPAASIPEGAQAVTAPLLGTFYARSKPGEAPFVKVGDVVEPDTVLCIVEVMKLMNSVNAGCHGVIAAVHAEDGQLVEFGQALFSIVPSDA
jgi:acetyl-CoA carboxylase biotin carboxyl carrier protein